MKIILANGTEMTPIMVTGAKKFVQNANRDALTFVFDDSKSLDELDTIFTDSACESITIVGDDKSENLYKGYTIRAELNKKQVQTSVEGSEEEATYEMRVFLTMAQRTYTETQIADINEAVDLLVLESLLAE